jgi:DNA-binding NtrC family response regulator
MGAAQSDITLLVVDDDLQDLEYIAEVLAESGLHILTTDDPEKALELVRLEHPQIVLSDIVMPKINGMQLLDKILEIDPAIEVILMTVHYSTEAAVEAIKKGACDYLTKPISLPMLRGRIEKLAIDARLRQRTLALDSELVETWQFEGMVGRSPLMREMWMLIRRVARHGQRAGGPRAAQPQSRGGGPAGGLQLFRGSRDALRERAVRAREGRVYRRQYR